MTQNAPLPKDLTYDNPQPPLQLDKLFKFQQRIFFDMSAGICALAAYLGDRLGLFAALSEQEWMSASDLVTRRQVCPDMTHEWLRVMTCAGYIEYDPRQDRYRLAPEHAMILANDFGPTSLAGGLQQIGGFADQLPQLLHAFRDGAGVPQPSYSSDLREGMERLSATWLEHELVERWLPALPVADTLRAGGTVADVGCGGGRALICLAKAFSASRFVGYDVLPAAVERSMRNAAAAGVTDRVNFEVRDVVIKGFPEQFDLITAFDSLHDFADPVQGLAALARSLKRDGTLLVLELDIGADLLEQAGPVGVIMHGTKLFYNLPVGISAYGKPRPNVTFHDANVKSFCRQAGLVLQRTLPVRNPLHKLFVIKAAPF
jgi:SAM-dependent methyltransferase